MRIIGVGTDIVECLRIAQLIQRHADLFLNRVFTAREIEYCSASRSSTQHYAGRWAAKEAVLKALGTGWTKGASWRDIEIRNDARGRPTVAFGGGIRLLCERLEVVEMHVSISHCRTFATAHAIACGRELE